MDFSIFSTKVCEKVQSLFYFLNPKFQSSGHLLWLYTPVCVVSGRKPGGQVFSRRGSCIYTLGSLNRKIGQLLACTILHT